MPYFVVVNPNAPIPAGEGCEYRFSDPIIESEEVDKFLVQLLEDSGVEGEIHILKCVRKISIKRVIKEIE